jgi:hypothetical protein
MRKSKDCDQCANFKATTSDIENPCSKGHKPRFYRPNSLANIYIGNYGFRRVCDDFKQQKIGAKN